MRFPAIILAAALSLGLAACESGRSTVAVAPTAATNPATGQDVKITDVVDARLFEAKPREPSIPSLEDGAIGNKALTARAIARKRNGQGLAQGDVVLPEGQTVAKLVNEAVANGFRRAGYRVLKAGDAGYEKALPVSVKIVEFWSWSQTNFISNFTARHTSKIEIAAPGTPIHQSTLMNTAEDTISFGGIGDSDWQKLTARGLEAISARVVQFLGK